MAALVVYDSIFGNTGKVAEAAWVGAALPAAAVVGTGGGGA